MYVCVYELGCVYMRVMCMCVPTQVGSSYRIHNEKRQLLRESAHTACKLCVSSPSFFRSRIEDDLTVKHITDTS
jgi:hypothetical protein